MYSTECNTRERKGRRKAGKRELKKAVKALGSKDTRHTKLGRL
jgi:hypothetical protein